MWDDDIPMGDEQGHPGILCGIVFGSMVILSLLCWGWLLIQDA